MANKVEKRILLLGFFPASALVITDCSRIKLWVSEEGEINFRQWRSHGVKLTGAPGPRRWARGQTPWQSLKSPRKG